MLREGRGLGAVLGIVAFVLSSATAVCAAPATPQNTPARELAAPLDASIEIERAAGSEACPDSEAVFRAIRRLFPERSYRQSESPSESAAQARVVIRPLSPGYEAVMTVLRPRAGERVMREEDQDCRGLADALALAFVMLVDPPDSKNPGADVTPDDGSAASAASTAVLPPPPAAAAAGAASSATPPAQTGDTSRRAPQRGHAFRADVGGAAVGGLGVLSEPAFGAAGRLEFFHRSGWGGAVEALHLWSGPAHGQGGSVTLTLWACLFGPYYRGRISKRSSLEAGLLVGVGSQSAEVKGFASPHPGKFPWTVLMPALGYRLSLGSMASAFAGMGPVIQIRPQSFSVGVDTAGHTAQVAAPPGVGMMAEVGLALGSDIF